MNKRQKKKQQKKNPIYKEIDKIAEEILKAFGIECGKLQEKNLEEYLNAFRESDPYLSSVEKAWEEFLKDKLNK